LKEDFLHLIILRGTLKGGQDVHNLITCQTWLILVVLCKLKYFLMLSLLIFM